MVPSLLGSGGGDLNKAEAGEHQERSKHSHQPVSEKGLGGQKEEEHENRRKAVDQKGGGG